MTKHNVYAIIDDMGNRLNSEKTDTSDYLDGIDYIKLPEEATDDTVDSFGLPEYDDEARLGWRTDDIVKPPDFYYDGDPYIPKTISKTLSELEAEDLKEELRPIYSQGDRILSERQIRDEAEKRGVSIIDFAKYCRLNNIRRIDEDQQKDAIKSIENCSSPEQRAKFAKLALVLINAVEILEYAHMANGDISTESEACRYIKQAIILQRNINGEAHDEIAVEAAVQPFKDELVSKYIGPNNVAEFNAFLENQKKIKNDYDQETKASLKKSPNYNNRRWHRN